MRTRHVAPSGYQAFLPPLRRRRAQVPRSGSYPLRSWPHQRSRHRLRATSSPPRPHARPLRSTRPAPPPFHRRADRLRYRDLRHLCRVAETVAEPTQAIRDPKEPDEREETDPHEATPFGPPSRATACGSSTSRDGSGAFACPVGDLHLLRDLAVGLSVELSHHEGSAVRLWQVGEDGQHGVVLNQPLHDLLRLVVRTARSSVGDAQASSWGVSARPRRMSRETFLAIRATQGCNA